MLTRKCLRWTKFKVISRGRVLRTVAIGLKISVFPMRGLRRSVDGRRVVTLIHTFDSSKYPATRPPPSFTELRDCSRHVGFCQKPGIPAGACRLVVTSLPSARRLVVTSSQFAHAVRCEWEGIYILPWCKYTMILAIYDIAALPHFLHSIETAIWSDRLDRKKGRIIWKVTESSARKASRFYLPCDRHVYSNKVLWTFIPRKTQICHSIYKKRKRSIFSAASMGIRWRKWWWIIAPMSWLFIVTRMNRYRKSG